MNQFSFYAKKWVKAPTAANPRAGSWQDLSGDIVYPFCMAKLLDERLDEGHVTLYNSTDRNIKPGTLIRFHIDQTGDRIDISDVQYIVGGDDAQEMPVGSGKWKHDLYIIEPIKAFEGILCQTKTDTNALGAVYSDVRAGYYIEQDPQVTSLYPASEGDRIRALDIRATYSAYETTAFPSPNTIARCFEIEWGSASPVSVAYSGECIITDEDGTTSRFANDTAPTVSSGAANYVKLYYSVSLYNSGVGQLFYAHVTLNVSFGENKNPLAKWNVTTSVTRTLELAEPCFGSEFPKFRLQGVYYQDGSMKIEPGSQADTLAKIETPPFTMTQANLREQLRIYGGFLHMEPRAVWRTPNDGDNHWEVSFSNLNEQREATLPSYIERMTNLSVNEYSTEVRGNAQNLVNSIGYASGVMVDPGQNIFRSIRTDNANVRIETENGIVETAEKIYIKVKVECGIRNTDGTFFVPMTDITACVVGSVTYNSMSAYGETFPNSRACAIYYTRGEKNLRGLFYQAPKAYQSAVFSHFAISNVLANSGAPKTASEIDSYLISGSANYLKRFFPEDPSAFANLVFRVTYQPIYSTMFAHGKQAYDPTVDTFAQIYNQSENLIETRYFGENVKGVSARLGNVTESRTYILHDLNQRPEVGQTVDGMVIDAVSCEVNPYFIKCTLGLSSFNRISQYVGINSNKRVYQVSEREAYDRTAILRDYLLISTSADAPTYTPSARLFHSVIPFSDAFKQITSNTSSVSSALLITKRKLGGEIARVRLPVTTSTFGNAMILSFTTKDNYSAGGKIQKITGAGSTEGVSGYWQTDVPYSDYYGRAWYAEVRLDRGSGDPNDLPYTPSALAAAATIYNTGADYLLRKDNREKIGFAVVCEAKTTVSGLYIGSGLMMNSTYLNGEVHSRPKAYGILAGSTVNRFTSSIANVTGIEEAGTVSVSNDGSQITVTIASGNYIGYVIANQVETVTRTVYDEQLGDNIEVSETIGGEVLLTRFAPIANGIAETFQLQLIADK